MSTAALIAQLVQIGIATLEGVLKAQEIAARSDLTEAEKQRLIQADIDGMQSRLFAASSRIPSGTIRGGSIRS